MTPASASSLYALLLRDRAVEAWVEDGKPGLAQYMAFLRSLRNYHRKDCPYRLAVAMFKGNA